MRAIVPALVMLAASGLLLAACSDSGGGSSEPLTAEEQKEAVEGLRVLMGATEVVAALQRPLSLAIASEGDTDACAVGGTSRIVDTENGFDILFEACDDGEGAVLDGTMSVIVGEGAVTLTFSLRGTGDAGLVLVDGSGLIDVAASTLSMTADITAETAEAAVIALAFDLGLAVAPNGLVSGEAAIAVDLRRASCLFRDFDVRADDSAYAAACDF